MQIYDTFHNLSDRKAAKLCLVSGETRLTYRAFSEQANRLAMRLAARLRKGDRVLVKLADPVKQLLYFIGIAKAGGVCIIVDIAASPEVCAHIISEQSIAFMVDDTFEPPPRTADLPLLEPADYFLSALSSGSTGLPKLIWRDHQSWVSAFASQSRVFGISANDILYLAGSLAYTANLNACLHIFFEGGTVVLAGGLLPRTWLKEIQEQQVTAIFMVPANYRILLKALKNPLSEIRSAVSGGAKLDSATVENLIQAFPQARIVEYYGASELGHVSFITAEELLTHPDSVGKAFPDVAIEIRDNTIWVRSPYLAPAYRPEASVGDLGRVDEEGYLYIAGRKNGLINAGGIKVIPEQVEAVLRQCPGVADALVAGVDDLLRGQKVCAWIVKHKNRKVAAADILDFCRPKLRPHYCPQKIVFVDAIPLNANGKPDKKLLLAKSVTGDGERI